MNNFKWLIAISFLGISPMANAFDDDLNGFIIGVGAGFHHSNVDININDFKVGSSLENGVATSFKLGGGGNLDLLYKECFLV